MIRPRPPALPYVPRLRRLCLRPGECLVIHTKDLRHAFYVYGVGAERLATQVIGPHVPLSWFDDLDREELDYIADAPAWWHDDTRIGRRAPREAPAGFTQFALGGVIMGDLNAVSAVQTAHRALLLSCGSLETRPPAAGVASAAVGGFRRRLHRRPGLDRGGALLAAWAGRAQWMDAAQLTAGPFGRRASAAKRARGCRLRQGGDRAELREGPEREGGDRGLGS